MKSFLSRVFLLFILSGVMMSALAEYKGADTSRITGIRKKNLMEAVSTLKSMPKYTREAFFAEQLALSYTPNGKAAVCEDPKAKGYPRTWVKGAVFISSSGKERDWRSEYRRGSQGGKWDKAYSLTMQVGSDEVLSFFSKEITKFLIKTIKGNLEAMPPQMRDAWLSTEGNLLYSRDGSSPYAEEVTRRNVIGVSYKVRGVHESKALMTDSTGNEIMLRDVYRGNSWNAWKARWEMMNFCLDMVGRNDVLAELAPEFATLKQLSSKKQQSERSDEAPPAPNKPNDPNGTDAAPMTEFPDSVTAATLAELPQESRDKYLTEHFNLYFAVDGSNKDPYNSAWKWTQDAQYVGSDGELHFYNNHHMGYTRRNTPQAQFWRKMRAALKNESDVALQANYKEDICKLACNTAQHLLKEMPIPLRDAILADMAGLVYQKSGKSAYPAQQYDDYTTMRGRSAKFRSLVDENSQFVDSRGMDHVWKELELYANTWKYRWVVVAIATELAGKKQILNLFPEELHTLRTNYTKITGNPIPPEPKE